MKQISVNIRKLIVDRLYNQSLEPVGNREIGMEVWRAAIPIRTESKIGRIIRTMQTAIGEHCA